MENYNPAFRVKVSQIAISQLINTLLTSVTGMTTMIFRPKKTVFLAVSHGNDLGRLKHFFSLFDAEFFRPVFVTFSGFKIKDSTLGKYAVIDLDYDRSSLSRRLKYKINLFRIRLFNLFSSSILVTHYKNEISSEGTLSKLVSLICNKPGAYLCFAPHGVTSYGLQHEVHGKVVADILFYNTDFELQNTPIKRYLGSSTMLVRTGDLELMNLIWTRNNIPVTTPKHKICILASNLNQFKFTDENRMESIVSMIRFAARHAELKDIIFRPHPRFLQYNESIRALFPDIQFDGNTNGKETILQSEIVLSLTSSIAYESVLLGKKTIIIEPNEFKDFKCLFRPSPLKHFFLDELQGLDLNQINFDQEKAMRWVEENLTVERSVITARISELFIK